MVCDHLKSCFGLFLHDDVPRDCPIFLIYEIEKKQSKKLRYIVIMDPEVDFKDRHGDMKTAIIVHAVCDVSKDISDESGSKTKEIILQFFHNVIIHFNPSMFFLSGPFDNSHWLEDVPWLQGDDSNEKDDEWKELVGEGTGMFYSNEIKPYNVCLKESASSTYNIWIARLEVAPPKRMKKEKGTFYLLDSICGWVRMTPYLEKVYGFLVNKHLDIEEGRVVYLTGYGAAGIVRPWF